MHNTIIHPPFSSLAEMLQRTKWFSPTGHTWNIWNENYCLKWAVCYTETIFICHLPVVPISQYKGTLSVNVTLLSENVKSRIPHTLTTKSTTETNKINIFSYCFRDLSLCMCQHSSHFLVKAISWETHS